MGQKLIQPSFAGGELDPGLYGRVDLARYGHAMSVPAPGVRTSAALRALAEARGRVRFAHSDLSGYSIFEEAYAQGLRAAHGIVSGGAL